jgi:uncharacterized membrane protein YbhN (UPF0104 family)
MTGEAQHSKNRRSLAGRVILWLLVAAVCYFVAKNLIDHWQEISSYDWQIRPFWLALSLVLHLAALAGFSTVWCLLMRSFDHRVSFSHGFKISYIANLGRYLPGKIWPLFGMVYLAGRLGIRKEEAMASWGMAQLFAIPSSIMVGLLLLISYPELLFEQLGGKVSTLIWIAAALSLVGSLLLVFTPNSALNLANAVLVRFGRDAIEFSLSKGRALSIYIGYAISWLLYGVAFFTFVRSVAPENLPIAVAAGLFILAYQIGYLAIFAPGGIGIREFILTTMMTPFVGPIAVGLAVAARLWNMVAEILSALIALTIRLPNSDEPSE